LGWDYLTLVAANFDIIKKQDIEERCTYSEVAVAIAAKIASQSYRLD